VGGAAEGSGYAPAVSDDRPTKTLLLLSTHFYPAPTVAAVRWTQLSRHLPAHGWRVVVLSRYYGVAADEADLAAAVQAVTPRFTGKRLDRSGYGTDEIGKMVLDALG